MDSAETQQKLSEAMEAVVSMHLDRGRQESPPPPRPRRRTPLLLTLLVAWAGLVWAWIARPDAIFQPGSFPAPNAQERDALARHALYLQRARVEQFVVDNGRLPRDLEEAGEVEEGVTYLPTPPDFAVVMQEFPGGPLELTSKMDADSFLGDALDRLPRPIVQ